MPDLPFTLRFHLHPQVTVSLSADGLTGYLRLVNGSTWEFDASGAALGIEESVLFASPEGTRRTSQIIVAGNTGARASVAWTLGKSRKS